MTEETKTLEQLKAELEVQQSLLTEAASYSYQVDPFVYYGAFSVLAFCFLTMVLYAFVSLKSKEGLSDRFFRLSAVIFIGGLAVYLTVAGYSKEQMGGALGLLGTIAGYLLGREDLKSKKSDSNE
ncbi:MAG: hypothetical protein AB2689_10985 [Candidatus Thiodiazotropha taylori]